MLAASAHEPAPDRVNSLYDYIQFLPSRVAQGSRAKLVYPDGPGICYIRNDMGRSKTHYEALGVPKTAGRDEIRKAFRSKAKKLHPDAGGSADARLFHEAQNAYEVLRDPAKRKEYDRVLASASYASTAGGTFTDADRMLWELWEAFFGPESEASPGEYRHRTTEKRDAIRYTVTVTPEEAREGTRVQLPHDSRRKVYADIPAGSSEGVTITTEITDLFGSREIVVTVRVRESVQQKS